ncbi:MAG: response regulator [Proteobacteria bacterium]|nr:response regulator [Pseudomonadota bacterium]
MMPDKPELLIVDDEPSILANCEKILGKLNFNITTASNGLEALTLLKARSFDVVITDLKMSRMGGMAVLDHSGAPAGNPGHRHDGFCFGGFCRGGDEIRGF